jgi:DNA-directed RNA polymerase subunit RPC12/RpoP
MFRPPKGMRPPQLEGKRTGRPKGSRNAPRPLLDWRWIYEGKEPKTPRQKELLKLSVEDPVSFLAQYRRMEREHTESKRLEKIHELNARLESIGQDLANLRPVSQSADDRIQCNHCGSSILLFKQYTGAEVRCPECRQYVRVPESFRGQDLCSASSKSPDKSGPTYMVVQDRLIVARCRCCWRKFQAPQSREGMGAHCPHCGGPTPVHAERR